MANGIKISRAGRFRHYVEIQRSVQTRDEQGSFTDSWASIGFAWCNIVPIGAIEQLRADQTQGQMSHRIYMRYRSDITNQHRIKYGSRIFALNPPSNVGERSREIEILATEKV
jgi:SPP1 family predicted phage head-tail adaptor